MATSTRANSRSARSRRSFRGSCRPPKWFGKSSANTKRRVWNSPARTETRFAIHVNPNIAQRKRAILYDLILPNTTRPEAEKRVSESENLVATYGGLVLLKVIQRRHHAGSKSYIGLAKLEEIVAEAKALGANLVIVNDSMKPRQRYGIEATLEELKVNDGKRVNLEVWDRVDLILGIFDKHARTAEAKLQLELARIKHLGPRIFGMGKDMSNQGGGIGTRGLGETNTEIMKRHLAEHTHRVEEKISKLLKSREHKRTRRDKLGFRSAALVGYTNAGKSELFRSLTRKEVLVRDALFATLDTTLGKISPVLCPEPYLVSDTIGFIENLPMDLVAAFKSTLEEALAADLLLHVVDISDPDHRAKIQVVEDLLTDIGMNGIPRIRVYNKVDRLSEDPEAAALDKLRSELKEGVFISAKAKLGLDNLGSAIHQALGGMRIGRENGVGAPPHKLEFT